MACGLYCGDKSISSELLDMNARITIKRGLWVLLSIGIWMPEVGRAQSGWTVEECMRYAVEHNFRIRNRRLDSKMARTDVAAGYGDFQIGRASCRERV